MRVFRSLGTAPDRLPAKEGKKSEPVEPELCTPNA
jgi:hypothetical protein